MYLNKVHSEEKTFIFHSFYTFEGQLDILWVAGGDLHGYHVERIERRIYRENKINTRFLFEYAKHYRRARVVSPLKVWRTKQVCVGTRFPQH